MSMTPEINRFVCPSLSPQHRPQPQTVGLGGVGWGKGYGCHT